MERTQNASLVAALRSLSDGQAHVSKSGFVFLLAGPSTFHPLKSLGFEELRTSVVLVSRAGRAAARAAASAGELASELLVQPLDAASTSTATMGAVVASDSRTLGLQTSKIVATNLLLPVDISDARALLSMIGPDDSDSESRLPPIVVVLADGYLGRSYDSASSTATSALALAGGSSPSYAIFKITNDTPHATTVGSTATGSTATGSTATGSTADTENEVANMDLASAFRSFEARAAKSGRATNLGASSWKLRLLAA